MAKKKRRHERTGALIDSIDISVLRILTKSRKNLSIGDVQNMIKLSHVSFKVHVRRLIELKFITKERVPKMFKFILKPTKKGKELLTFFNNVSWK